MVRPPPTASRPLTTARRIAAPRHGCTLLLCLSGVLPACASADPIDVGAHQAQPLIDLGVEGEPVSNTTADGVQPRSNNFDLLLGPDVTLGPNDDSLSPHCQQDAFDACGGYLLDTGTWVVEDTCDAVVDSGLSLRIWGINRLNLPGSCGTAVRSLTTRWSGELTFEAGQGFDRRSHRTVAEIDIDRECLGAALDVNAAVNASPTNCAAFEARSQSGGRLACTAMGPMCRCLYRQDFDDSSSGVFIPGSATVTFADNDKTYEYCLADNNTRLLWNEPGTQRLVVMRHASAEPLPQRIEREPITIPH